MWKTHKAKMDDAWIWLNIKTTNHLFSVIPQGVSDMNVPSVLNRRYGPTMWPCALIWPKLVNFHQIRHILFHCHQFQILLFLWTNTPFWETKSCVFFCSPILMIHTHPRFYDANSHVWVIYIYIKHGRLHIICIFSTLRVSTGKNIRIFGVEIFGVDSVEFWSAQHEP